MLFSGGGAASKAKKDEKKEKKSEKEDRREIEEAVFICWANWVGNGCVKELADIVTVKFLSVFVHLVCDREISLNGNRAHDIGNLLQAINKDDLFSQVNVHELVEGNARTICHVCWLLVKVYWMKFATENVREQKMVDVIKAWCVERLSSFEGIRISDFVSSWRDGYALNALLLSYDPNLFEMDDVRSMRSEERIEHAMSIGERLLSIPRLLNPKDFRSEYLDMKSVVCYLASLYLAIHARLLKDDTRKTETVSVAIPTGYTDMHHFDTQVDREQVSSCAQSPPISHSESTVFSQVQIVSNKSSLDSQPARNQDSHEQPATFDAYTSSYTHPLVEKREHFSRQFSVSSQRSRRSRKSMDEIISEYQHCLEQVLAWLLEAEEQTRCMGNVEEDIQSVKVQFREYEQFMQSLTDSQESVGRVLHRGNVICQKLDEEQSKPLLAQLYMVNTKWDRIREFAMARQSHLQRNLNDLQMHEIEQIQVWLDEMEAKKMKMVPPTLDVQQIEILSHEMEAVQSEIECKQRSMRTLSTFVAIVDETNCQYSHEELEKQLRNFSVRWMSICDWAESRAEQLNGLVERVSQYMEACESLSKWLDVRDVEMGKLRQISYLITDSEVNEEVGRLQSLELALEAGHEDFVALSQIAVDLMSKFGDSCGETENVIQQQIDLVTRRWDAIVSEIDEHSRLLVKSGKADARRPEKISEEVLSTSCIDDHTEDDIETEPRSNSRKRLLSFDRTNSDVKKESSTLSCTAEVSPADTFLHNLQRLARDLEPLLDWTCSFDVSNYSNDLRNVIQHCQEKLREIKVQEINVNELHSELDRLHSLDLDVSKLQDANDKFEDFTRKWSRIVAKISDALNTLSAREMTSFDDVGECDRIFTELQNFFEFANNVITNCSHIHASERESRLGKLDSQICEQEKNIAFLEANYPDKAKMEALKSHADEVKSKVSTMQENIAFVLSVDSYLQRSYPSLGNFDELSAEYDFGKELVDKVQNFKIHDNKMAKLEFAVVGKHNNINELFNKAKCWREKEGNVNEVLAQLWNRFHSLKKDQIHMPELICRFKALRGDYEQSRAIQKEFVDLAEETAKFFACSTIANRDVILNDIKCRIQAENVSWKKFENEIDETINILEKENKKFLQNSLHNLQKYCDNLNAAIDASHGATDAEEFSEHLDNLERLCHTIAVDDLIINEKIVSDEQCMRQLKTLQENCQSALEKAKEQISFLESCVKGCEKFDALLSACQTWCNNVNLILSIRLSNDLTALDIPHEYKTAHADGCLIPLLQIEFDEIHGHLCNLRQFVNYNAAHWPKPNRLQLQLDHVSKQFDQLMAQFVEFKQPIRLEENLSRLFRDIREIEEYLDEFTDINCDMISETLDGLADIERRMIKVEGNLQDSSESKQLLFDNGNLTAEKKAEICEKILLCKIKIETIENRRNDLAKKLGNCHTLYEELTNRLDEIDHGLGIFEANCQPHEKDDEEVENTYATCEQELDKVKECFTAINEIVAEIQKESIKVNQAMIDQRLKRFKRIKNDLILHKLSTEEVSDDRVSDLKKLEDNCLVLLKKICEMENCKNVQDMMERCKPEKEAFLERYRRLVEPNDKENVKLSRLVFEIDRRWNAVERNFKKPSSPVGNINLLLPLSNVAVDGDFSQKVSKLRDIFKLAQEHLDFDQYPVSSVAEWSARVEDLDRWVLEYGESLKEVLETGRKLASNGRMELDVHNALDHLDRVVDLAKTVEFEMKTNKSLLTTAKAKSDTLIRDINNMNDVLNQLHVRDLTDPTIANATRRDILDRQSQLSYLQRKSDDLREELPGKSSVFFEDPLEILINRFRQIEEAIDVTLMKDSGHHNSLAYDSTNGQLNDADALSVNSTGPISLALEVQETEDERSCIENAIVSNAKLSDNDERSIVTADLFYSDMDQIEKILNEKDALPYDELHEKFKMIKALDGRISTIERIAADSQMTMDVFEHEIAQDRLMSMRHLYEERVRELENMLVKWENIQVCFEDCERHLLTVNEILGDVDGRNKSPDIDELESVTINLEDNLQRAWGQIQHTSVNVESVFPLMSDATVNKFRCRLRDVGEKWKECEGRTRTKRRRLDERLADESQLSNEIDLLEFWCDEAETECAAHVNSLNLVAIAEFLGRIKGRIVEFESKKANLHSIERLKDRVLLAQMVEPSVKHRTRRIVSELGKRMSTIRIDLGERKNVLTSMWDVAQHFLDDVKTMKDFCNRCEKALHSIESATIFVPSGAELDIIRAQEKEMEELYGTIVSRWEKGVNEELLPEDRDCLMVDGILEKYKQTKQRLLLFASVPTLVHESSLKDSTILDPTEEVASEMVATDETMSETIKAISEPILESELPFINEYGVLNDSIVTEEASSLILPPSEQELMNAISQFVQWLNEVERYVSLTVDIIDIPGIREAVGKLQSIIDQLKLKQLDVIRVLDQSQLNVVRKKTELTLGEWNRILSDCKRRKGMLSKMLDESRSWDRLKCSLQLWLCEAQERINRNGKLTAAAEDVITCEIAELEELSVKVDEMKIKMAELNSRSNALLDQYRVDDGHNLSHLTSKINNLWSRFNDNLRIRRAVLDAALRSKSNFRSALSQLEVWMTRIEASIAEIEKSSSIIQAVKDLNQRRRLNEEEKSIRIDVDAHNDVISSVDDMGRQLMRGMDDVKQKEALGEHLDRIDDRWKRIRSAIDEIKAQLTNAEDESDKLVAQLSQHLFWTESQSTAVINEAPVGGSLTRVQSQNKFIKKLEREVYHKQREMDSCITLARSYLMQHNLRPRLHTPSALGASSGLDDDKETAEIRRFGIQIKSDSDKLEKTWNELKAQVEAWSKIIDDAHEKMERLTSAVAECQLALSNMESKMKSVRPVEALRLEELMDAVDECEELKEYLAKTRIHIDDANDWSGQLLASDVELDPEPNAQLKCINDRMNKLKTDVKIRAAALDRAVTDFGPSSQHFLMNSVRPPWQRAVSATNHLPYYINHETELTQWDHPVMMKIISELSNFNQVKFCAYRTALKLRAIQKRLCLDLLSLQKLDAKLRSLDTKLGESHLAIKDAIMCLMPLFESVHRKFPLLVRSIPLAVDLILNFVLNVYDPARGGILRTLSFKVALVILCSANILDKYKYLYHLISSSDGVDQKRLAVLLHDVIQIPKFLGEAAAFGGSNIEPSVRSCFEISKSKRMITMEDFLTWLKMEPQSIVWLSVMHRLTSAELAKHQAKCNICKMFPIIGLRYRCLKCFNVDVCQNCFFSKRVAKNHKLSHPMQEYCHPTSSSEDVRDFGTIVRNKFRSRSRSKVGYLPVQTVDEGVPLETINVTPSCAHTEPLHNRVQLCSQRLRKIRCEDVVLHQPSIEKVEEVGRTEIKSPLQLLSQVEQMHKEELDQVLHKLQYENRELKKEIERRKRFGGVGSTPNLNIPARNVYESMVSGRSVPSIPSSADEQMLREAHLLRQHKERLEQRSRILEEQNRQLEVQLSRLRIIIDKQNMVDDSQVTSCEDKHLSGPSGEEDEGIEYDGHPNRMHTLIASVDQLGRAMQSLVVSVVNVYDEDPNEDIRKTS